MDCIYCGSADLRFSHAHLSDVPNFLLLKVPFRCRSCSGRMYLSAFTALMFLLAKRSDGKREA
jgi:hypothetical protein